MVACASQGTQQLPDLSLCFLPALRSRSAPCPTSHCRCQRRLVFSRCFDGKCQHLSPWSLRAFRSYDLGSDASAVGRVVTTHRVTRRTAVYQHSSLIKEEEVRRVLLASKCFHFHDDKIKWNLSIRPYWTAPPLLLPLLPPSFLPFILSFLLNCEQVLWGQAAGGKVFTIVNLNMCGSPLKGCWHKSQKGYALCAKILMKWAVLSSS